MKTDLFKDWIPSISQKTEYLFEENSIDIDNDELEKSYPAYLINKTLSYQPDTVLAANEMNRLFFLDPKLQYDFLFYIIPKKKRFFKWEKGAKNEKINMIKEAFSYSNEKAEDVVDLIEEDQLKLYFNKGGKK